MRVFMLLGVGARQRAIWKVDELGFVTRQGWRISAAVEKVLTYVVCLGR